MRTFSLMKFIKLFALPVLILFNLFVVQYIIRISKPTDVDILLQKMAQINRKQVIRNANIHGPVTNDTVVIVVQVHKRLEYLTKLVHSLSKSKGIKKALLIFSHDVWDSKINKVVSSIRFAKVLQIFFPYSIQTHVQTFPGDGKKDCSKDSADKNCINAAWPDSYGHYREGMITQTKHHWWWKMNRVFDQLEVTKYFQGLVLLLEEDYYVAKDFLHVLDLLQTQRLKNYKDSDILVLGNYYQVNYKQLGHTFSRRNWTSGAHNMGMALDRVLWNKLKGCVGKFCTYDDYNWDWSLQYVSRHCLKKPLDTLHLQASRVFHVGECGLHHLNKNCKDMREYHKAKQLLEINNPHLFPSSLSYSNDYHSRESPTSVAQSLNGGWSDLRDHLLCQLMTIEKIEPMFQFGF